MDHHIIDLDEDDNLIYVIYKNSKPYFSKILSFSILLSYFLGIFFNNDNFDDLSPSIRNLYFRVIVKYPYCQDNRYQIWRFITSSYVHLNLKHLIYNSILLYPLLYYFDIFYRIINVSSILLSISFLSNLIFYYYQPYSTIIGCSHLVFGLFGALLGDYIINKKYKESFYLVQIFLSILVIFLDILVYFFDYHEGSGYIVHWGGYLVGFLSSLIFLPNIISRKYNYKIGVIGYFFLFLLCFVLINNYIFNWPPKVEDSCCYLFLTNHSVINCIN